MFNLKSSQSVTIRPGDHSLLNNIGNLPITQVWEKFCRCLKKTLIKSKFSNDFLNTLEEPRPRRLRVFGLFPSRLLFENDELLSCFNFSLKRTAWPSWVLLGAVKISIPGSKLLVIPSFWCWCLSSAWNLKKEINKNLP